MTNQEFRDLLRQSASVLWEKSISEILKEDVRYLQSVEQEEQAEQRYLALNLTSEQRQIIDEMLQAKERTSAQYNDAAYLAGIQNTIQMYRVLKL